MIKKRVWCTFQNRFKRKPSLGWTLELLVQGFLFLGFFFFFILFFHFIR